jgi:hypothetical protein
VLVVDRHGAGRRCHPKNIGNDEIAHPRKQLGRASCDLALEMLSQRLLPNAVSAPSFGCIMGE